MKNTNTNTTKLETRGARNLAAPAPAAPKGKTHTVRIWYRSEGGEILACDSRPLSLAAARALEAQMRRPDSEAVGAQILVDGSVGHRTRARVVVLPSQGPAPERLADDVAPVAAPVDWQLALVAA